MRGPGPARGTQGAFWAAAGSSLGGVAHATQTDKVAVKASAVQAGVELEETGSWIFKGKTVNSRECEPAKTKIIRSSHLDCDWDFGAGLPNSHVGDCTLQVLPTIREHE